MIVGLLVSGADQALLRDTLALAVSVNERFYRRWPASPRIDGTSLLYRPDHPSAEVLIRTAPMLEDADAVSCGTASAAFVGWMRAHGRESHVCLRKVEGSLMWHAYVVNPYGEPPLWDPAKDMKR